MFDIVTTWSAAFASDSPGWPAATIPRTERRIPADSIFDRLLDEVDLAFVVLTASARLVYANRAARRAVARGELFTLQGGRVNAGSSRSNAGLVAALLRAASGRRVLLTLGEGASVRFVALVPMSRLSPGDTTCQLGTIADCHAGDESQVLLIVGRPKMGGMLDLQFFAHEHALTSAEALVLGELCEGHAPREIAQKRETSLSTVRTQIASVLSKTRVSSIRELLQRVATLPPLMPIGEDGACPVQ